MLASITSWVEDAVRTGGPLMLVLVMFVENVFPPIPSELVLPLAGYLVHQGQLNPVAAVLAATLGSVLGAVVLYEAGRQGGRPLLLRWGHVLRVDEAKLDRADSWMDRHGTKIVFAARMVPLARSVVSVPAGTTRMGRPRFLLYTTVGSLVWNCALVSAGYLLGAAYKEAAGPVGTAGKVVAVLAVAGVVYLALRTRQVRRRSAQAMPDDGDDGVDVTGQGS